MVITRKLTLKIMFMSSTLTRKSTYHTSNSRQSLNLHLSHYKTPVIFGGDFSSVNHVHLDGFSHPLPADTDLCSAFKEWKYKLKYN